LFLLSTADDDDGAAVGVKYGVVAAGGGVGARELQSRHPRGLRPQNLATPASKIALLPMEYIKAK
jgi:hypothetical protein